MPRKGQANNPNGRRPGLSPERLRIDVLVTVLSTVFTRWSVKDVCALASRLANESDDVSEIARGLSFGTSHGNRESDHCQNIDDYSRHLFAGKRAKQPRYTSRQSDHIKASSHLVLAILVSKRRLFAVAAAFNLINLGWPSAVSKKLLLLADMAHAAQLASYLLRPEQQEIDEFCRWSASLS